MSAPVDDLDALDQAVAAMSSGPWTLDPTDDDIIAPDDSTDLGDMSASAMGHDNADRLAAALEVL